MNIENYTNITRPLNKPDKNEEEEQVSISTPKQASVKMDNNEIDTDAFNLTTGSNSIDSHEKLSKTHQSVQEALKHQIHLLELSKIEAIANYETKTKKLNIKIKELSSENVELNLFVNVTKLLTNHPGT